MAKTYTFTKRDRNRYRKTYRYIRKKPVFQFICDDDFKLVVGDVDFTNTAGPVVYTFPSYVTYINVPVITAISHDSENNDQANVNIYINFLLICIYIVVN